jgi:hypothetical protein
VSQSAVEKALGKLITDECFRRRFFRNPSAATLAAGLALSGPELDALARLPLEKVTEFSGCVDPRICRLPLEQEAAQGG